MWTPSRRQPPDAENERIRGPVPTRADVDGPGPSRHSPGVSTPDARPPIQIDPGLAPLAPPERFAQLCAEHGIELEDREIEQLGLFLAILLDTNERLSLTAIKGEEESWERHVFDALTLLAVLHELPPGAKVIDVGSGTGVPAIPLAIALPELRFTLVEATGKKARFLEATASALGLENVHVEASRAELVGRDPKHREKHDVVIARAVGSLRILVELCLPLVSVQGRAVLVKGGRADEELAEASKAMAALHAEHLGTFDTPTGRLVILEKTKATGKRYPRRPGELKRAPL